MLESGLVLLLSLTSSRHIFLCFTSLCLVNLFFKNILEEQHKYKAILLHYDWYLLTVANPDGYQETWTGIR